MSKTQEQRLRRATLAKARLNERNAKIAEMRRVMRALAVMLRRKPTLH